MCTYNVPWIEAYMYACAYSDKNREICGFYLYISVRLLPDQSAHMGRAHYKLYCVIGLTQWKTLIVSGGFFPSVLGL